MKLDALIDGIALRRSGPDVEVVDLTSDSREVRPGWAFLALQGKKADGAAFVPQAWGMEHLGPMAFTGLRFALGALVVAALAKNQLLVSPSN